jgi:tetratricopeptide (TPR) repeat protein
MRENPTSSVGVSMHCDQVSKDEIAEKYLLGQLSQADQEAYELHYFECSHCFDQLQTHRVLYSELKCSAVAIRRESLQPRMIWHWKWATLAATAVLILGLGFFQVRHMHVGTPKTLVTRNPRQPTAHIDEGNANASRHSPETTDNSAGRSVVALATVEPAPYLPVVLRGDEDEATQQFQLAMRRYLKADYAGAIRELQVALKRDPEAADIRFYLGVSYLLGGKTDSAIEELRKAVDAGDSPYFESEHFYLAKAYIAKSNLVNSVDELRKTVALHGSHEAEARQLIEQIEFLRRSNPTGR